MDFNYPIDRKQLREYIHQFEESGGDLKDLCKSSNNPLLDLMVDRSEKEKEQTLSMLIGEVRSRVVVQDAVSVVNHSLSLESDKVDLVGMLVILTSIIGTVICIFSFGKVPVVNSDYSGFSREWSGVAIFSWICVGFSGVFFGYLLKKIASLLRHLERLNKALTKSEG